MNPVVMITGASSGIGRAAARAFAERGCILVLNSRSNREGLEAAARECRSFGTSCITVTGDVSDPAFCGDLVRTAEETFHVPDILVNNAGIAHIGLFQDMEWADWDRILRVNLYSVLQLTRLVIPGMIRRRSGRIVNISSVWGNTGASCEAVYSASKGAVNSFTKALAKELAPSGICVNAIAFGAIDTPMNASLSEEDLAMLAEEIPAGRLGRCEEAADLIVKTAFAPEYLTGQIITMDGGWT